MTENKKQVPNMFVVLMKSTEKDLIVQCTGKQSIEHIMKIISAIEVLKFQLLHEMGSMNDD